MNLDLFSSSLRTRRSMFFARISGAQVPGAIVYTLSNTSPKCPSQAVGLVLVYEVLLWR